MTNRACILIKCSNSQKHFVQGLFMITRRKNGTINPKWNHGPTVAIRIPLVFKKEVVEYARALDDNEDTSGKIAMQLMNAYLRKEYIDGREAARNYSSPRWYFFNKFREWIQRDKK
ncbi:MAG: hypothetical protein AAF349_17860 [Cyanobacteria bacterium P01_A01_bin.68]